jgi:hypothetical protein
MQQGNEARKRQAKRMSSLVPPLSLRAIEWSKRRGNLVLDGASSLKEDELHQRPKSPEIASARRRWRSADALAMTEKHAASLP